MLHFPRPVQKAGQFLLGAGGISADFESAEAHRQVKALQLSNIIREFRELLRINAWGKAHSADHWKWWKFRKAERLPWPGRSAIAGQVAGADSDADSDK